MMFRFFKVKSVLLFLIFYPLLLLPSGCMAQKMNVNVVVFNYDPEPIAEVIIQDQYVGGVYWGYGPGGTGGGIYCCIDVKPGEAQVEWEMGWPVGKPLPPEGIGRSAIGHIPKPTGSHKYLGVHIYPSDVVEFTLSRNIPGEKKEGAP